MTQTEREMMGHLLDLKAMSSKTITMVESNHQVFVDHQDACEAKQADTDAKLKALTERMTAIEYWRTGFAFMGTAIGVVITSMGLDGILKLVQWLVHRGDPTGTK